MRGLHISTDDRVLLLETCGVAELRNITATNESFVRQASPARWANQGQVFAITHVSVGVNHSTNGTGGGHLHSGGGRQWEYDAGHHLLGVHYGTARLSFGTAAVTAASVVLLQRTTK
jgi:hypothetical protein